jgi:hypothetical protein
MSADILELLASVPSARELREVLASKIDEVHHLRALLKLAESQERRQKAKTPPRGKRGEA